AKSGLLRMSASSIARPWCAWPILPTSTAYLPTTRRPDLFPTCLPTRRCIAAWPPTLPCRPTGQPVHFRFDHSFHAAMTYLLALDQGTSSSRSIVFDKEGSIVALAQREITQIYPEPGWVEHDPMEIWQTQLATAREAIAKAGLQASDIHAIGITNQRETTLVWNRKTGQPIYNAIVWQDRRAEPTCAELRAQGLDSVIQQKTGLRIDAYFSGTKLKWILDHVPDARTLAIKGELAFGTVDSWLIWQLTKGQIHTTDVSNASRTMLFNVHDNEWDAELMQLLDVNPAMMPRVLPSSAEFGAVQADLLGHAIPICGV